MLAAIASLFLTAVVGFGSAACAADQPAAPAGATSAPAMKGRSMMGSGTMAGGMMHMDAMPNMGLSDERLAAVKAELNLTDAQLPLWNAIVEAAKANALTMLQSIAMMRGPGASQAAQSGYGMMRPVLCRSGCNDTSR